MLNGKSYLITWYDMFSRFPIDKPEAKSQFKVKSKKGKREIGLLALTKILWATPPPHNV